MCLIGLIENIFAFQTCLYLYIDGKICRRHLTYLLILSANGLLISFFLPIGIICSFLKEFLAHISFSDVFILLSIMVNTFSVWISSALSIDIALFNVYVGKMRSLSASYALVTSILLMLFVIGSYLLWIIDGPLSVNIVSTVCSIFHLLVPCLAHTMATIITLTSSIRRRMRLYKDKTTFFDQLLSHEEYLRSSGSIMVGTIPYFFLLILICYDSLRLSEKEIISSEVQILLITSLLPPQMLTFHIYITPRQSYMREYHKRSLLGRLIAKIRVKKNKKHLPK